MTSGLIIAAPRSDNGKTLITLGLLRYFARCGMAIASAKSGPDYIDPAFHTVASGQPCISLDTWAMRPETMRSLVTYLSAKAELILVEGVMGLFDGAIGASDIADGSTASLAAVTGWPVVLVVDVRGQVTSVAAMIYGFLHFRQDLDLVGVILNQVSSLHHSKIIRAALAYHIPDVTVLGAIPNDERLRLPARYLGLVQAREMQDLEAFVETVADVVGQYVDLDALQALAKPTILSCSYTAVSTPILLPPLGQRIAIALDNAFTFIYPAVLSGWNEMGAEIVQFSPLNDEPPPTGCDAIYLPGGYPELYAGRLAANANFMTGLRISANRSDTILFGECGGYMVLGHILVDANGYQHAMSGILPLATSFVQRRLQLGYRVASLLKEGPLGCAAFTIRGHEFHYATILNEGPGEHLFTITDTTGQTLGQAGLQCCNVMGSFIHLIDTQI